MVLFWLEKQEPLQTLVVLYGKIIQSITRCELISYECMEVLPSLKQGYFPVCMHTEHLGTSLFFEHLSGRLDF